MGKSAVGQLLALCRVPVLDTDWVARQVVEPGQPALAQVAAAFGPGVLDGAGALRRDRLAQIVFASDSARLQLEAILHPPIRAAWKHAAASWAASGAPLGSVIIPLLFETDAAPEFDAVLCVACSEATQQRRLLDRGWDLAQIRGRLAAQWPVERKIAASTFVLWTEGALDSTAAQLDRVLRRLS